MKRWLISVVLVFGLTACASSPSSEESPSSETGSQVNVFDIEDASFYDDTETFKYYWGANFSTDQPPSIKLNCRISALNNAGEEILSAQGLYNVVNNGATVAYGQGDMPTTTKDKFKAISSYDISCTRALN